VGVNYDTAWLLHNKILRAMTEREEAYLLRGNIQMDDSYLGGELPGGSQGGDQRTRSSSLRLTP
jgi:hypothetical protein